MAIRPIDDANVVTPRGSIVGPDFNTYVSGGVYAGPLLKAQYTNFMLWSEDMTNAAWVKSGFSANAQVTITDQFFTSATRFTTTTTSGLVYQSMPASAMVTGGCYQMTASMRLISGNANVQIGIGGQFIQKVSGVVLTSFWQTVNIYTLVGRDNTQTVPSERASGNIYGAYFYIPSGTIVEISGVQMTMGNFIEPYVKTTSLYGRVAPRYETGCMYVTRRERNYLQESNLNNITSYWTTSLSGVGSGVANSTTSADSPVGAKNTTRLRNNSTVAGGRGVLKNMALGSGQDLQKPFQIIATIKAENINGITLDYYSASTQNGMYYALDSIDGVVKFLHCSGRVMDLGDGWKTVSTIPGATAGAMNLAAATAFNLGPRVTLLRDSSANYLNQFASIPDDMYLANWQILDTYNIPSFFATGASSGEVSGDIVTIGPENIWSYPSGTLMIDFYVDEYFGIASTGDDRYIRTILDLAETETKNRIRFFKNKPSHSYGLEIYDQNSVMVSGGFTLTLPIGWHRLQLDYTQTGASAYIDGTSRLTVVASSRNAGSVINIGSNRFNTWENYGGYLKNFHAFDQIVSTTLSGDSQTRYSTYKSSESVTNVDSIQTTAIKNPSNWAAISGASSSATGGILDPTGGFNAYRWRITGGSSSSKFSYAGKFATFRQNATYTRSIWYRFISSTGTSTFSLNGQAASTTLSGSAWTLSQTASTPGTGNGIGISQTYLVSNSDITTGAVLELEIYDPLVNMAWTRSRDTFTPNNEINIPVTTTTGLRFKHNLASQNSYGLTGTWTSEVIDAGRRAAGRTYIAAQVVDSKPGLSTIVYEYAGSDNIAGPFVFTSNLSQIAGRYTKVKATIRVDDVSAGFPSITQIKLIPGN